MTLAAARATAPASRVFEAGERGTAAERRQVPPYWTHAPRHLERVDQLRPGQHPDQAVRGRVPQERQLQPARLAHRRPHQAQEGVRRRRRGGARRGHREGLRARPGRLRHGRRRRAGRPRPRGQRTIDIEEFVDLADIDPLFYDSAYYVAARQGHHEALRPARPGDGGGGQGRRGPVRDAAKQYLCAIRPKDGAPGAVDDGLRRRGQRPRPRSARSPTSRTSTLTKKELDMARAAHRRRCPTTSTPDRFEDTYREPGARPDRAQGGGRDRDRRGRRGRCPRTRSSTSWRRWRPASRRPRRPAGRHPAGSPARPRRRSSASQEAHPQEKSA